MQPNGGGVRVTSLCSEHRRASLEAVTTSTTPPPSSNAEVAERIGCDYTTVSRLRSGKRTPGLRLLRSIIRAYGLDEAQQAALLRAVDAGPEASGRFLVENVFGPAHLPD